MHSGIKSLKMVFPSPKNHSRSIKEMTNKKNQEWTSVTIYNRILSLCEEKGWTISRLTELSNVSQSTFFAFRYRKSMPSIDTLVSICEAFGITLSKFFLIEDSDTNELYIMLNNLSPESRKLLKEVAKRMKE